MTSMWSFTYVLAWIVESLRKFRLGTENFVTRYGSFRVFSTQVVMFASLGAFFPDLASDLMFLVAMIIIGISIVTVDWSRPYTDPSSGLFPALAAFPLVGYVLGLAIGEHVTWGTP